MALDPKGSAAFALHRFGFGPRPGQIAAIASDPRGALLSELDQPLPGLLPDVLPPSDAAARIHFQDREEQRRLRLERLLAREGRSSGQEMASQTGTGPPAPTMPASGPPRIGRVAIELYRDEVQARLQAAIAAQSGLVERLVWFWSNHFCVSAHMRSTVAPIAGAYEREAIRPHVNVTAANGRA